MPFSTLRSYIINQLSTEDAEEAYDFQNSFSEVLLHETTHEESVILLMALVPHVLPGFYEDIIQEVFSKNGELPEFGGVKEDHYRSMQPTGETVQYILAKNDVQERICILSYFDPEHWFYKDQILTLNTPKEGMPLMSGKLILSSETLQLLMFGKIEKPQFSTAFPAKELTTLLDWKDLVLNEITKTQIRQIRLWIKHESTLRRDVQLNKIISPGYRVLFYGPSGTGKTLTASLIGKEFNLPVYRVDLSQVASKYVGQTEKTLEKIFTKAENKNWILFFDECDALYGKRSSTKSAQDRFANQQVSYLLQRIEHFNGIIILASNLKNNIDQAFLRRLHLVIPFVKPNADERLMLWQKALPKHLKLEQPKDLEKIAETYDITGAQIVNAIIYTVVQTIENDVSNIKTNDLLQGIRLEYQKEEKLFTYINNISHKIA